VSQRKLAEQYGRRQLRTLKKNELSIINAVESNCSQNRNQKMKKTENEEVNNIILEFVINSRAQNIPVTGTMLQAKAMEITSSLQIEKFTASNVWLRRFSIGTISASGHYALNLPKSTNKQQMIGKDTYLLLLKDMPQKTNADETAIFYRQLPRKSMVFKGESCKGGKFVKERLSIMLCCSANGEKLKPLIIGN
jgi:hypothetical protein